MKKSLIMFLSICLLVGIMSCAFATADAVTPYTPDINGETVTQEIMRREITGIVKEIKSNETSSTVIMNVEGKGDVEVSVYNGCQIISAKSQKSLPLDARNFEEGTEITVSYSCFYDTTDPDAATNYLPKGNEIPDNIAAKTLIRNDDGNMKTLPHTYIVREVVEKGTDKKYGNYFDLRVHTGIVVRVYTDTITKSWDIDTHEMIPVIEDIPIHTCIVVWHESVDAGYVAKRASIVKYGNVNESILYKRNFKNGNYEIQCLRNEYGEMIYTDIGNTVEIETRTYVPLRKVLEALGPNYYVTWNKDEGVLVYHNNVRYQFNNGSFEAKTSLGFNEKANDDICVVIRDGVTYVPCSWMTNIFQIPTSGRPAK